MVERALIAPPASRIGPLTAPERQALIKGSLLFGQYEQTQDRESAFERLKGQAQAAPESAPQSDQAPEQAEDDGGLFGSIGEILFGRTGPRGGQHDGVVQTAAKSVARTLGNEMGRQLVRGVLGSLLGGSSKRRR
jgi:uncharacterized protein